MKKVLSGILLAISTLSLSGCFQVVTPSSSNEHSSSSKESLPSESFVPSKDSSSLIEESTSISEEVGFSITANDNNGKTSFSQSKGLIEGDVVEVTFTPNKGYTLISYTITDELKSTKIPAYKETSASVTISSNTTIEANYVKSTKIETFNYSSGNSKLYHYSDGQYKNSSSEVFFYEDVIGSIKNSDGEPIDSSIFSVTPITTFANGKWANLYYSKNNYGLSLYSSETEYSGITFNSTKNIYSITVTYYDENYPNRALVESNGSTLTGFMESETVYTYLIDGNNFSITNISEGKYLYIPSIEIVYEGDGQFDGPITVSYDANGGTGSMEPQVVKSENFNLNESQFSKLGYNFVGWSDTPNGEMLYGDGDSISGSIVNDTTLYALYIFEPTKSFELIDSYQKSLTGDLSGVYAYYGGDGDYDICKYIPSFDSELADKIELQFGRLVYVGAEEVYYNHLTANFVPVSQSYKNVKDTTLIDAYLELAYAYYYQGTQLQYDQGSSYQRKIRNMKPEDATELYHKYLDCSTFVSNAFYNAFGDTVVPNTDLNSITTKTLINYARDNINKSTEVVLYQDNLLNMTSAEKTEALNKFKSALQPGDLYIYRHTSDSAGHVMLYVGNGYFLHSTGGSYNYTSLTDRTECWTSVQGTENPEGSVRYQSASSTVYNSSTPRYLFYVDPSGVDSNDRYALLRPLNRKGLTITPTTLARCAASGLEIEKSADKTTSVTLGDYINYTISIKNNSSKTIKNISITDEVAENTTFVSMEKLYFYKEENGKVIWNIPSITASKTITLSYKVLVTNDASTIGKKISSTGKVGHLSLNTLNMSISSLSQSQLNNLVTMALQYYNNSNVYYDSNANNSVLDPTTNVVTFANGASFITTLYKRYYASIGKELDLCSELESVSNTNFMNSIISSTGTVQKTTLLSKMMVNGGYGGTLFKKDYTMDRMRTVKVDYLLPGDIISFTNSSATNQYLYLGTVTVNNKTYSNALLLFTTSSNVKMVYGSDADALLVKFIGYKRFAVIRPSLYI